MAASLFCVAALSSCGGTTGSSGDTTTSGGDATSTTAEKVKLTVWGGELEASQNWLKKVEASFQTANPGTTFEFTTGAVSESNAKDQLAKDPTTAADVAIIADDQLYSLAKTGVAQKIDDIDATIVSDVKTRNSSISVASSMYNDGLYAFPVSNSNGYFLYYNSNILSETDCDSFEGILSALKTASLRDGKVYKLGVPSGSGWYEDGFWHAVGYDAQRDDSTSLMNCDWNSTTKSPTGVQVVESLLKLSQGEYADYWVSDGDSALMTSTKAGSTYQVVATINGTWSASTITDNYGDGAAATDLPSWTCNGESYHMNSVGGSKLAIVNSYLSESGWATKFANFLTNSDNQVDRYNTLAEAPTNTDAAGKVDTSKNYAVAALAKQGAYAFTLNANDQYWAAVPSFFTSVLKTGKSGDTALVTSGTGTSNLTFNETAIQSILDTTVTAVKAAATAA